MSNLRYFVVTPFEAKHHTPSVFCTLCTEIFYTGVTSSICLGSLDTKTILLNRVVEEEVYVEELMGFETQDRKSHVCKLKKALYGLK